MASKETISNEKLEEKLLEKLKKSNADSKSVVLYRISIPKFKYAYSIAVGLTVTYAVFFFLTYVFDMKELQPYSFFSAVIAIAFLLADMIFKKRTVGALYTNAKKVKLMYTLNDRDFHIAEIHPEDRQNNDVRFLRIKLKSQLTDLQGALLNASKETTNEVVKKYNARFDEEKKAMKAAAKNAANEKK